MKGSSGHGHVTPRADGRKENCGGPSSCKVCIEEKKIADSARCASRVLDNNLVYRCSKPEKHDGRHEHETEEASFGEWRKKNSAGLIDRKSYEGDWLKCGGCKYDGPMMKGDDVAHARCEEGRPETHPGYVPPPSNTRVETFRQGWLVTREKEGQYGIHRQVMREGKPHQITILAAEEWDSIPLKLLEFITGES